jgi:hypothetical protein
LFISRRVNELWEEELEESKQKLIERLRVVEQLHHEVASVQVHQLRVQKINEVEVGGNLSGLLIYTVNYDG